MHHYSEACQHQHLRLKEPLTKKDLERFKSLFKNGELKQCPALSSYAFEFKMLKNDSVNKKNLYLVSFSIILKSNEGKVLNLSTVELARVELKLRGFEVDLPGSGSITNK